MGSKFGSRTVKYHDEEKARNIAVSTAFILVMGGQPKCHVVQLQTFVVISSLCTSLFQGQH